LRIAVASMNPIVLDPILVKRFSRIFHRYYWKTLLIPRDNAFI